MNTKEEVLATLERLNTLLSAHDPAIVGQFAPDPDVLLLGSEAGELVVGHEQLRSFFADLLSRPITLGWEWKETRVTSSGDVAWVFARGDLVVRDAEGTKRSPYRMTGVLERRNRVWLWRQFHGSEPIQ